MPRKASRKPHNQSGHDCPGCGGAIQAKQYPTAEGERTKANCGRCRAPYSLLRDTDGGLVLEPREVEAGLQWFDVQVNVPVRMQVRAGNAKQALEHARRIAAVQFMVESDQDCLFKPDRKHALAIAAKPLAGKEEIWAQCPEPDLKLECDKCGAKFLCGNAPAHDEMGPICKCGFAEGLGERS